MRPALLLALIACAPADDASSETGTVNAAPTAPVVSIAPTDPVAGVDDLLCQLDTASTDPDGDAVSYRFAWTVDGAPYLDAVTGDHPGDTVPAAATAEGQLWSCTATPTDGMSDGQNAYTSTVVGPFSCEPTAVLPSCGGQNTTDDYYDPTYVGPNPMAYKQVATEAIDIQRVEIWTGDVRATNRLSIWTDDGDAPGVELTGANFTAADAHGWQGASFPTAAQIGAGETYWVVWWPAQFQQAPIMDTGTGTEVAYMISQDSGLTWGPTVFSAPWKFRLYCCE